MINYLRAVDLWESYIYENEFFEQNLNELKQFNINISQTISLYEILGRDIDDNFCEEEQKMLEEEEHKNNKQDEEKNDDDVDPFATNDDEDENVDDDHY